MGRFARWFGLSKSSSPASQGGARIAVDSVGAEYAWLQSHPCACGGPWSVRSQSQLALSDLPAHVVVDRLSVECAACRTPRAFDFEVDTRSLAYQEEGESALRDLGLDPDDLK